MVCCVSRVVKNSSMLCKYSLCFGNVWLVSIKCGVRMLVLRISRLDGIGVCDNIVVVVILMIMIISRLLNFSDGDIRYSLVE